MRKLRAEEKTIKAIANIKGVSYRQAYDAVADINPGEKYTEEQLQGRHERQATSSPSQTEESVDETSPPESSLPALPTAERPTSRASQESRPGRDSIEAVTGKGRDRRPILVRTYEDVLEALKMEPGTVLLLASEAYRAGYSSLGEWIEGDVLPWMRFVGRVQSKFEDPEHPGEPITPDQFGRILDEMAGKLRVYRERYEELKEKVNSLISRKGDTGGGKKVGRKTVPPVDN